MGIKTSRKNGNRFKFSKEETGKNWFKVGQNMGDMGEMGYPEPLPGKVKTVHLIHMGPLRLIRGVSGEGALGPATVGRFCVAA